MTSQRFELTTVKLTATKAITLLLFCSLVGCGRGTSPAVVETRLSAQQAYDEGVEAFQSKDFSTAEQRLTEALEAGGLYSDLFDLARARQVVAMAAQGKIEEAQAALAIFEANALEKDLVFSTRSYVLRKQGKKKESKAAWARARRINRYVKRFAD